MKRAIIIHGWGADSSWRWFQEEREELTKKGYKVLVPDMPDSTYPVRKKWVEIISNLAPDEETILIGHSMGGTAILSYLQEAPKKVKGCILIAAPVEPLGVCVADDFFEDYDWEKIRSSANWFLTIYQKMDFVVPEAQGRKVAKYLNPKEVWVDDFDHFIEEMDIKLINDNLGS